MVNNMKTTYIFLWIIVSHGPYQHDHKILLETKEKDIHDFIRNYVAVYLGPGEWDEQFKHFDYLDTPFFGEIKSYSVLTKEEYATLNRFL
jgi:hypothetical protein